MPLTLSFTACRLFATGKDGIAALSLKRTVEVGSYQTAWAILDRLGILPVRPGREHLVGTVEVDETCIGGRDPGAGRGKGRDDTVLTGSALEIKEPSGYGRCRIAPLADASAASLQAFVCDRVEPAPTVITDGWQGDLGLDRCGYTHEARSQRAARFGGDEQPGELLPAVHRVASLAKRWILGTHRGAIDHAHLHDYLNEFVFRFNRRHSRGREVLFYRVLELAVRHVPVRYADIAAGHLPCKTPPMPPSPRGKPASLERAPADRRWRPG
jgi:transposase-like protein